MSATTATRTWPTANDSRSALTVLSSAMDPLDDVISRYTRMINADNMEILADGAQRPTLADVGQLSAFVERLKINVDYLNDWIKDLQEVRAWASLEHEREEGGDAS